MRQKTLRFMTSNQKQNFVVCLIIVAHQKQERIGVSERGPRIVICFEVPTSKKK